MKNLIIYIACILWALLPGLAISNPYLAVVARKNASAGGGPTLVDYSEEFTDVNQAALDAKWTALSGSKWTLNTTPDTVSSSVSSHWTYTAGQVNTLNQWTYCKHIDSPESSFAGPVLRSENNASNDAYVLRAAGVSALVLRSINGHSGVNDIYSWNRNLDALDYFGFCVTGTGASTEFHLFDFGATDPALSTASTLADMKAAAGIWILVDSGVWIDNDEPADVGKYGGLYDGGSASKDITDWNFGDWTP